MPTRRDTPGIATSFSAWTTPDRWWVYSPAPLPTQADIVNTLSNAGFAGGVHPDIYLHEIELQGQRLDVLLIKDRPEKPYYLQKAYISKGLAFDLIRGPFTRAFVTRIHRAIRLPPPKTSSGCGASDSVSIRRPSRGFRTTFWTGMAGLRRRKMSGTIRNSRNSPFPQRKRIQGPLRRARIGSARPRTRRHLFVPSKFAFTKPCSLKLHAFFTTKCGKLRLRRG